MVIRPGRILSLSSTLMPNLAGLDAQGWREGYQSCLVFKDCKLEVIVKVGFVLAYLVLSDPIWFYLILSAFWAKSLGRTADSTSQNISNILTFSAWCLFWIVHPNDDPLDPLDPLRHARSAPRCHRSSAQWGQLPTRPHGTWDPGGLPGIPPGLREVGCHSFFGLFGMFD